MAGNDSFAAQDNSVCAGSLVTLESAMGQERVMWASPSQCAELGPAWRRQRNRTFCGLASLAMILRADGDDRDEDDVISLSTLPSAERGTIELICSREGFTLSALARLMASLPSLKNVVAQHADELGGPEALRLLICAALAAGRRVILNYHMSTLGQVPAVEFCMPVGHIGCISAMCGRGLINATNP